MEISDRHRAMQTLTGKAGESLSCILGCCCTASKFATDKEVIEVASKPDLEETVVD